tara:strand:- start:12296 stop:13507 length:1212 start_codon:yes stop_codon:yes gene_type:complete
MISKHLFQSLMGVVSSLIGTIVIFVIAGRSLGASDFGHFSVAYATCSLFGILFDFGYMTRLLKETHATGNETSIVLARETLIVKSVLFALLSVLITVFAWVSGLDLALILRLWIGVCLISVANLYGATLRAAGRHLLDSRNNFLANICGAGFAIFLSFTDATQHEFALVFIVTGSVHLITTLWSWRSIGNVTPGPVTRTSLRREVMANIPYSIDALGQRSFFFLDVMILSLLTTSTTVGLYQAAQKLAQGANIMAQPMNNVLLPRLSRAVSDKTTFKEKSRLAVNIYLGIAAGAGLAMWALGPTMIELLYSDAFSEAKPLMWVFAILTVTRYLAASQNIQITALGLQKTRSIINLCSLGIFVIVAFSLGSIWGSKGVVLAFVVSFTIIAAAANRAKRKHVSLG